MSNPADEFIKAVVDGDAATVDRLAKANPKLVSIPSFTRRMLVTAASSNHLEVVQTLVELGADIHSNDGDSPEGVIYDAARDGAVDVVRWMLEQGAQVNYDYEGDRRCLAVIGAAGNGSLELVRMLVEHGAEYNIPWNDTSALSAAQAHGHEEVVAYLRSIGAK